MDLNAYSEMKTIKYLSFIPETRDLADKSLLVGIVKKLISDSKILKECGYFYGLGQQVFI